MQGRLYLQQNDVVVLSSWNSYVGASLTINVRVINCGEARIVNAVHIPATNRTRVQTVLAVGPGWLDTVAVFDNSAALRRGHCYITVTVERSSGADQTPQAVLLSGYVTAVRSLGYPDGPKESSTEGPGLIRTIVGTNPAAGVEIVETVPTNAIYSIQSVRFMFATGTTVINRRVNVLFDDGANIISIVGSATDQAANDNRFYCFYAGYGPIIINLVNAGFFYAVHALPLLRLHAGYSIRTSTQNLQAGDDYGVPTYLVEEWIQP